MNHSEVDNIEHRLHLFEHGLESVGRNLCNEPNGADCWHSINKALEGVRDAIRNTYKLRPLTEDSQYFYDIETENGDKYTMQGYTEKQAYANLVSYLKGWNKPCDSTKWRIIGCRKVEEQND